MTCFFFLFTFVGNLFRDGEQSDIAERSDEDTGQELVDQEAVDRELFDQQTTEDNRAEEGEAEEHQSSGSEAVSSDESEYQNSDEDDLVDNHDNEPLYNGARITLKESALAILSFALSHKLSGVCINDLLALIALHCGPNNNCFKSLHLFKSYFAMLGKNDTVRHHYCSTCEVPLETKSSVCNNCNGRHEVSYFIEFPIAKQLQTMYKRPLFYESLQFKHNRVKLDDNNIEDMYDADIYKECTNDGFLSNPNNISFNMFFDGLAVFKNSRLQLWPIYLSINELKYKDRTKKENIVIAGIWFGKHKPNPNLFLRPICVTLDRLQFEGLNLELSNGQIVNVKGRVLAAVGDLPAKALFMRLMQYNGLYSCFYCTSSGARYALTKNTVQVFPYTRNFEIRKHADMINFGREALHARQLDPEATVYGVKGPSQLAVCLPDIVRSGGLDVMHSCFLGLMRTLIELWFDPAYSGCPFSIANCVDIVDSRLKKIKPPFSFQRLPRSLKTEIAMMKASDYKMFFFYYAIPVLSNILPEPYWNHLCKIVSALSMLSKNSVSPEEIDIAEELLHSYVSEFQDLYGVRYLGLNLHQLLHIPLVVRNLGPSWVYSCFFYESLNGQLLQLVHGTRHAALQMSSSASACMNLTVNISKLADGETKELCLRFLETCNRRHKIAEVVDGISVLGLYQNARLPQYVRRLLWENFNVPNEGRFMSFFRLKKKGIVFSSEDYLRSKKKQSCFVEILQGDIPLLGKIKSFVRWSSCDIRCPKLCANCPKRLFGVLNVYERLPWKLHDLGLDISHLSKVTPTDTYVAFTPDSLTCDCVYLEVEDDEYICCPVNTLEVE